MRDRGELVTEARRKRINCVSGSLARPLSRSSNRRPHRNTGTSLSLHTQRERERKRFADTLAAHVENDSGTLGLIRLRFFLFFFYDGKDKGRRTGALTAKLRNDKFNFGKRQTFRLTRNRVFAGSKWWKLSLFPKKRCSSVRVRPCLEQPTRWLRRNQKRFINATGS